jgi:ABC-type phosphate/phosphonate transport system substrate-binding protein
MYDLPELRQATDAWWSGLARALRKEGIANVPDALARPPHTEDIWSSEDLLLSQICGYNMVAGWRGRLTYVATPCYAAAGCEGPLYSSVILVSATSPAQSLDDLRGLRCVINGYGSHSGCNALRATIAPLARGGRFFGSVTVSGSHAQSIAILEQGDADVTAIDCVTYAILTRVRPELSDRSRRIGRTVSAPVGPYVTRRDASDDFVLRLQRGLAQAIQDPHLASTRRALLLEGFETLPSERYDEIARLERSAFECRYQDFTQ